MFGIEGPEDRVRSARGAVWDQAAGDLPRVRREIVSEDLLKRVFRGGGGKVASDFPGHAEADGPACIVRLVGSERQDQLRFSRRKSLAQRAHPAVMQDCPHAREKRRVGCEWCRVDVGACRRGLTARQQDGAQTRLPCERHRISPEGRAAQFVRNRSERDDKGLGAVVEEGGEVRGQIFGKAQVREAGEGQIRSVVGDGGEKRIPEAEARQRRNGVSEERSGTGGRKRKFASHGVLRASVAPAHFKRDDAEPGAVPAPRDRTSWCGDHRRREATDARRIESRVDHRGLQKKRNMWPSSEFGCQRRGHGERRVKHGPADLRVRQEIAR